MYEMKCFRFRNSNEYEFKLAGRYGAKGEKRAKRRKATPEQVNRQNQWNRETKVRRLIKANFCEGDLWMTLKYPKGIRKPFDEVKEDMRRFREELRKEYKKRGQDFKWINRIEIGARGGIHAHMIANRIREGPGTDVVAQQIWERIAGGRINYTNLYAAGGYKDLAKYLAKQPDEEQEKQLSFYEPQERRQMVRYSSSRNLVRPQPEVKTYRRRTVRRMVEDGIKPTPGYYIDPESVRYGINPFNGTTYLKYIECRLEAGDRTTKPVKPEWQKWPEGGG